MTADSTTDPTARQLAPTTPTESALRRVLRRAEDGVVLNPDEAETLLHARGEHLARLVVAAGRVRDAGLEAAERPKTITYSRKVFIPLTHLCRDRCHYCTFVTAPGPLAKQGKGMFLSPDEVLDIARRGAELGCKEALFTLGDRPEDRWPEAREWLDAHGYESTLAYLRAVSIRVLEETGLLPHLNPGVMSWEELGRLKPVAPSMGMMLETSSRRLFETPGLAHFGSPDKDPALRLRVIEDAGRLNIPFTTGILVGIGETLAERIESLFDLRKLSRQYGHVQEVIVQNFRAKPGTAMRSTRDADHEEYVATIAVARLILGPKARVQAPPNLSDPAELASLIAAGVDDWGGVSPLTPDHVNPERPWPHLDDLAGHTSSAGFVLRERLTVHPEFALAGQPWIDPRVLPHVTALMDDASGLGVEGRVPVGLPWQEPDAEWGSTGRTELHVEVDTTGRTSDRRSDFSDVYGDWQSLRERFPRDGAAAPERLDREVAAALRAAEAAAAGADETGGLELSDEHAHALAYADGADLQALCALADGLRQEAVGDTVTYVVTRNVNFTNVCYTGCRFCAFAQRKTDADAYTLSLDEVGRRAEEAWAAGATEICMQGGIHPDLPGSAYLDLAREIKRRVPALHVHAFSPMEVVNGASRMNLSIREFLVAIKEAGVSSVPGTAAEILDDDVRWVLTKGKLPAAEWIEVISTAHAVGLPSSSTMMYGHVDTPAHWVGHLRTIAATQDRSIEGGAARFTEFVLLPFVHQNSPIYLAGVARPGPSPRDNLAAHALARVMLHGRIANIQTSWVKLGAAGAQAMLRSGVNDLGGTLMEETISRMAGSAHGSSMTPSALEAIAEQIGRPVRQRTTLYGEVPAERVATSRRVTNYLPLINRAVASATVTP